MIKQAALWIVLAGALSINAASAETSDGCSLPAVRTLQPDELHGVRTKWQYTAGVDARRSIAPDLMGLPLETWAQGLESAGVNLIDLNLDPRDKLKREGMTDDGKLYAEAAGTTPSERTPAQERAVALYRDQLIPHYEYSAAERDMALLTFLDRLENLRQQHRIAGSFEVILHQRQWFRPGGNPRLVALRAQRESDFAADMGDFIVAARQKCLDHWIAGVRLGENDDTDMSEYLPILVRLARGINERTGGWLKNKLFIANGGGMGAEYKGISQVSNFFSDISGETGAFAFGYKWMQLIDRDHRFIASNINDAACGERRCSADSAADWENYLGDQLGFSDLKKFVRENHARFPNHADVVFVGDSSDSVTLMVHPGRSQLADAAQLTALRKLWPRNEPGWKGKLFMNGYTDPATLPAGKRGTPDSGMALFLADDKGHAASLPKSADLWRHWP